RHPAWRLLRARNAPLILAFLGSHFVHDNQGATPAGQLASALDDFMYSLDRDQTAMSAVDYLDDWSSAEAGWLRRFYPASSDEVHYDATPDFEKAYSWVSGLISRPFIGTESRLQTVVALLREIAHGSETDPQARLAELERQRDQIDAQIADVKAGRVETLEPSALRERYHQASSTARELLSDFREVEANFRALDRDVRQKIAAWDGSKGDLISELVASRGQIDDSDQGR